MRLTAKLLGPVLEVGDVGLTPLVGGGVLAAPFGGDPPEVAARVFALGVVAHVCCVCVLCGGKARDVIERRECRSGWRAEFW